MSKTMDEFKQYVKHNPKLKNDVISKKRTWQDIYEEFVLYGDSNSVDLKEEIKQETKPKPTIQTEDMIKNVLGYIKKIDPDQITKTVNSIQKVLELIGSFGAGATVAQASKSTLDPLFDRKFDEWY